MDYWQFSDKLYGAVQDRPAEDVPVEWRCGGGSPAPGGHAAAAPRLESIDKDVTGPGEDQVRLIVSGHSCRCRTCPSCGKRLGWQVRQKLLAKRDVWERPALFTLTIDRSKFGSPAKAHKVVTDGRYLWRLMRALGVRRWLWVLEFQTKTGEGWPHWHFLIDLADLPGGRVPLAKAWQLWRDTWHLGGLDLSAKKIKLGDVDHAIFYLTKYLTKQPEGGYPTWVLKAHGVKFFSGCRELGRLSGSVQDGPAEFDELEDDDEEKQLELYSDRRPLLDRMSECGTVSHVYLAVESPGRRRPQFCHVTTLPISPQGLEALSREDAELRCTLERQDLAGKEVFVMTRGHPHELRLLLWRRPSRLKALAQEVEYQRERIVQRNRFAQREASIANGVIASSGVAIEECQEERSVFYGYRSVNGKDEARPDGSVSRGSGVRASRR